VRLLACRLDGRAPHTARVLETVRAQYGERVCRIAIPENIVLSMAATEGVSPARFAASSSGARAYAELAEELDALNAPLTPKGTHR
jgi:cellulose biosynthesis protein BcsQ